MGVQLELPLPNRCTPNFLVHEHERERVRIFEDIHTRHSKYAKDCSFEFFIAMFRGRIRHAWCSSCTASWDNGTTKRKGVEQKMKTTKEAAALTASDFVCLPHRFPTVPMNETCYILFGTQGRKPGSQLHEPGCSGVPRTGACFPWSHAVMLFKVSGPMAISL